MFVMFRWSPFLGFNFGAGKTRGAGKGAGAPRVGEAWGLPSRLKAELHTKPWGFAA